MASWVTHLIIADRVLERVPILCRHEFCVGNIAPDCNVENEDWTEFTPSREVTHLITDAEFQRYIRDTKRVAAAWDRIKKHPQLREKSKGMPENWDSVKLLINGEERMKDIYSLESEYLKEHPCSGYLTEIIGLQSFPDYIDYLPKGAIVRKVHIMGDIPRKEVGMYPYIGVSKEEYSTFLYRATEMVIGAILKKWE